MENNNQNKQIKIILEQPDNEGLILYTSQDSDLTDWQKIFWTILTYLQFSQDSIREIFTYDEFGQEKINKEDEEAKT